MIPTRPKKSRSEVVEPPVEAVRTHVGLQTILEWAGKESGIDEDLKTCFEIGDAQKLSSIARYWVATDGDTLPRMETWQMMNPLPYEYPITQDVYGKLLRLSDVMSQACKPIFEAVLKEFPRRA